MRVKLDTFTRAYLECALWSSTDESDEQGGDPLDKNYEIEDFAPEALAQAIAECSAFQHACDEYIEGCTRTGEYDDTARAGHDFWLTRNGHGAGFWDGDWPEPNATLLDQASKAFGETYPYVGDDGAIYFG